MAKYKKSVVKTKPKSTVQGTLTNGSSPENVVTSSAIQNQSRFSHVEVSAIKIPENVVINESDVEKTIDFIEKHGQILPVLLRPITEEVEKFGVKFKESTGKYDVVDGMDTVISLQRLYNKNGEERFSLCQAMVLNVSASEEEIQQIRDEMKKDTREKLSPEQLAKVTKGKEIESLYDFEEVYLEPERLLIEYNNFDYSEEEIEMLAESILHYGMWELPLILPYIKDGEVKYRIIAGHKRITAVLFIKQHNKENTSIQSKLEKIKVRLLPLGSTKEQIEAVHEYSNLMRRQLTSEQGLAHISMAKGLPPIPDSEESYNEFVQSYSISSLVSKVENFFKALGWNNWKNRKASRFLTVYYFGCDALKEAWASDSCPLNQKELVWIVTEYKAFDQKGEQEEVLTKSLADRSYLVDLMASKKKRRTKVEKTKASTVKSKLILQSQQIKKLLDSDYEQPKDEKEKQQILDKIKDLKAQLDTLENRYNNN